MFEVTNQVLDQNNVPVPGASIYVYIQDGITNSILATLTSDGTTPLTQPVLTDEFGNYKYYANTGYYIENIWFNGQKRWVNSNVAAGSPGADLTLRSDLAAINGYSLVGGTQRIVTPQQFGATGNGVTDDSAAFVAAIAYLKSIAGNLSANGYDKASTKLYIPAGKYWLNATTLDITHNLIIEGDGGAGFAGGAATMLVWAAGATGIRVQAQNTSGASSVISPTFSGAFTLLRNLYLKGGFVSGGSVLEGEYHGIHIKATTYLENITVDSFQGDGLYAHNTINGGSPDEGFSNSSRAYNCTFTGCRNGRSNEGADSNVWVFTGSQYLYNRANGVDEQSFLGNLELGPHSAGNGITPDNTGTANFPAACVSYSGNRYAVIQGQETGASTNAPSGTTADNTWWYYLSAGGVATGFPAWTSGMTLRCGAPYRTNNTNGRNIFMNAYSEGGQGYEQYVFPTLIQGGLHGPGDPRGTGLYKSITTGGSSAGEQINGGLRLTGTNPGFSGPAGLELYLFNGTATVAGYNRTGAVAIPLLLNGLSSSLQGNGTTRIQADGTGLGFFGATTAAKPTVTGSRGSNAALTSLLSALNTLGLLTDSSTT